MTTMIIPICMLTLTLAAEPTVKKNIAYADSGNEKQTLDVYYPAQGNKLPIAFWIHGGGWQAGDKKEVNLKPQAFCDKGFVFISVNYRLLPSATIKEMGQDLAKALRWVHDHAEEFRGDASTFVLMGHSAGAQLAALLATDESYLKAEKLSWKIVKGCVPVDGDTYDVPMQIATVAERIAKIYRRKFGNEQQQKDLSPVFHVAKGKAIPPVLILHVADHPETKGQSERLVAALKKEGFQANAFPAKGKTHTTINEDLGKPGDPASDAMWEFLGTVLRKR